MPWLMVRLPCGSRSTQSARCPLSTNAAARLSVVVVFATPPFWLVNAMTFALGVTGASGSADVWVGSAIRSAYSHDRGVLLPPRLLRVWSERPRQATGGRDRQGRRGQDHRGRGARPGRRAGGQADDDLRGGRAGAHHPGVREAGRRLQRRRRSAERLHAFSINPEDAKEEWLKHQLRSGALAGLLSSSRIFQYLTAAAPGLAEIVTIGKVWELAQLERRTREAAPYDLVIVDAPATGHGLALLRAPRTYADDRQGRADPQPRGDHRRASSPTRSSTAVVRRGAGGGDAGERDDRPGGAAARTRWGWTWRRVLVNGVLPERFSGAEAKAMRRSNGARHRRGPRGARPPRWPRTRARRRSARRSPACRRGVDAPVATLPFLLTPEVGLEDLDALSARAGAQAVSRRSSGWSRARRW